MTRIFSVDPRSLRLFVFLLGAATLWDAIIRFPDAENFYSSLGIYTDQYVRKIYEDQFVWSFNLLNRSLPFQQLLILIQAIVSIAVMAKGHSPLRILILWALFVSRQIANNATLSAGDELLRFLLFWSCFIPGSTLNKKQVSAGSVAMGLQLISVYFFSAYMKTGDPWRVDGTAVSLALSIESFTLPFGRSLLAYPELLKFFTFGTLYMEAFSPLLFILTGFSQVVRILYVLGMMCFHVGLALTFKLGYFPFVCIVAWSLWFPSYFWEILKVAPRQVQLSRENKTTWRILSAVSIYLSIFCLGINFNSSKEKQFYPGQFLGTLGDAFALWQKWGMFAPLPSIDDGWNQFEGVLADGSKVLINSNGGEHDGEISKLEGDLRPKDLAEIYRTGPWKKVLVSLHSDETLKEFRESYMEYLCRRVERKNPNIEIRSIDFFYNVEWTKKDLSKLPAIKIFVVSYNCEPGRYKS